MADKPDKSDVGDAGETEVKSKLLDYSISNPGRKLKTNILGEKWPIIDGWVQFRHKDEIFYFFMQIKSTTLGVKGKGRKKSLEVTLEKDGHEMLFGVRGPTYLIGVDLPGGGLARTGKKPKAYICAVNKKVEHGIYAIPTSRKYKLNLKNIDLLFDEVVDYWSATPNKKSEYKSNFER